MTKLKLGIGALLVAGAATMLWLQHQALEKLGVENDTLREQMAQPRMVPAIPSPPPPTADNSNPLTDKEQRELLRLRAQVGAVRRQTNELGNLLATSQSSQPRQENPAAGQLPALALPEDYPKTADGATKGIFDMFMRGDWNTFFANFGEPGVPREMYDRMFGDPRASNYFASMESVSFGQPTNSFGSNMYFVPYKIRFKNGGEKEWRLHVAQDPKTQRWYFKGGI